ncbi:MAG: segregation and condensation protein A [Planctomycetota bacterium]
MAAYRVNLEIFAGPLDLLLYLVRREEVDIYDIPIAKITDQYIRYIEMLKSLDIDLAGDFLVMASTLMEIKSAMLLPGAEPEQLQAEDLADPRAELIRQLLEYKKFKDAANLLNAAADRQKERFPRPDSVIERLKPDAEPEIDIEQVSVWDLLEAFDSIMKATSPIGDISHIRDDTPIDLYQIEILHRLQTEGPMSFERVFESKTNRIVMIGLFLALLELIRERLVWVKQPKSLASIYLKALTDEPAEEAVQKAILAAVAESQPAQQPQTQQREQRPISITELPPKTKPPASVDEHERIKPAEDNK